MDISFCEFSDDQTETLKSIMNTIFEVKDFTEIMNIYEVFKNDFPGPTVSTPQIIKREKLQPRTNQKEFLIKYNDFDFQIGMDLPVLLSPGSNIKGTIFIIAEDPLRDFKMISDGIRLSTPFGVHMQEFRNQHLKIYWQVILLLLEQGFAAYITDYYKLWIKRPDKSKLRFRQDLDENFCTAFEKEKEGFKPDLIITFGNPASQLVGSSIIKTKKLSFPHPSRTANGKWKKTLTEANENGDIHCTDENKFNYMKLQIESTLHSINF